MVYLGESHDGQVNSGERLNSHNTGTQTQVSNEIIINGRSDGVFKLLVFLAVITLIAAVLVTVTYLLSVRFGFCLITPTFFSSWVRSDRLVIGVVGVCLLGSLEFTLLARRRIMRSRTYGIKYGCPACSQRRLIRIHRHLKDRLLATIFRLPLRRYVCQTCQWTGVMVYTPAMANMEIAKALKMASVTTPQSNQAQTMGVDLQTGDNTFTINENVVDSAGENVIYATKAVVNAPFGLSLRGAPHNAADILLTLQSGTVVTLVDPLDEDSPATWRRVAVGDQVGWVSTAFLRYLG